MYVELWYFNFIIPICRSRFGKINYNNRDIVYHYPFLKMSKRHISKSGYFNYIYSNYPDLEWISRFGIHAYPDKTSIWMHIVIHIPIWNNELLSSKSGCNLHSTTMNPLFHTLQDHIYNKTSRLGFWLCRPNIDCS